MANDSVRERLLIRPSAGILVAAAESRGNALLAPPTLRHQSHIVDAVELHSVIFNSYAAITGVDTPLNEPLYTVREDPHHYAKQGQLKDFIINPVPYQSQALITKQLTHHYHSKPARRKQLARMCNVFVNEPAKNYANVKSKLVTHTVKPLPQIARKRPDLLDLSSHNKLSSHSNPSDLLHSTRLPPHGRKGGTLHDIGSLAVGMDENKHSSFTKGRRHSMNGRNHDDLTNNSQLDEASGMNALTNNLNTINVFGEDVAPIIDFSKDTNTVSIHQTLSKEPRKDSSVFTVLSNAVRKVDPKLLDILDGERDYYINSLLKLHATFDMTQDESDEEIAFEFITDFMLLLFIERYRLTGVSSIQYATQLKLIEDSPEIAVAEKAWTSYCYMSMLNKYLKRAQLSPDLLWQLMTIVDEYTTQNNTVNDSTINTDNVNDTSQEVNPDTNDSHGFLVHAISQVRHALRTNITEIDEFTIINALFGHLSRLSSIMTVDYIGKITGMLFLPMLFDCSNLASAPYRLIYGVKLESLNESGNNINEIDEDNYHNEFVNDSQKQDNDSELSPQQQIHQNWIEKIMIDPRIATHENKNSFTKIMTTEFSPEPEESSDSDMETSFDTDQVQLVNSMSENNVTETSTSRAETVLLKESQIELNELDEGSSSIDTVETTTRALSRTSSRVTTSLERIVPVRPSSTFGISRRPITSHRSSMAIVRSSGTPEAKTFNGSQNDIEFTSTTEISSSSDPQGPLLPRDIITLATSTVTFLLQKYAEIFDTSINQYNRQSLTRFHRVFAIKSAPAASCASTDPNNYVPIEPEKSRDRTLHPQQAGRPGVHSSMLKATKGH